MNTQTAYKIGECVIDAITGEILEFPPELAGAPERVAWVTGLAREAAEQEKAWKSRNDFLRNKVLKELLVSLGVKSMHTDRGSATFISFERTDADIKKLPAVIERHELNEQQVQLILTCADSLSATKLAALGAGDLDLAVAILDLLSTQTIEYVKVGTSAKPAPKLETVEVLE